MGIPPTPLTPPQNKKKISERILKKTGRKNCSKEKKKEKKRKKWKKKKMKKEKKENG